MAVEARAAAIAGIGETDYVRGTTKSELELGIEAVRAALGDAGLVPGDVDGIVIPGGAVTAGDYAASLGIDHLAFTASLQEMGGAMCVAALEVAEMLVATQRARHVVVPMVLRGYSGRRVRQITADPSTGVPAAATIRDFYAPFGAAAPPQYYAWMAVRHMRVHGTTERQLGCVAVAMRAHAARHPNAIMRGSPMTLDDHQASQLIAYPFRVLDCCLESDGAAAVVVTTSVRAKDLRRRPVAITGVAQGHPYPATEMPNRADILDTGVAPAAAEAFRRAGVRAADVDFAMVYDAFTYFVLRQLEELGFCGPGEGGPFVESGAIGAGGRLPVNTHGGLLSQAHVAAMNHVVEAVRQLRGEANERQVADARLGVVSAFGGHGHGAVAILEAA